MTHRGCIKAWSLTWPGQPDGLWHKAIFDMKTKLERTLGMELESPCTEMHSRGARLAPATTITYCEICTKTDPSRIHCPISAQLTWDEMESYIKPNISAHSDYSDWQCQELRWNGGTISEGPKIDYSYWSMYDDGSICDCGSPFVVEINMETSSWNKYGNLNTPFQVKFRRPKENEASIIQLERESLSTASTLQSTRCSGRVSEDRWKVDANETCVKVAFAANFLDDADQILTQADIDFNMDQILPPSIPAARCHSRPDISSIFEDETETKISCIEENTYLSWYNGEPIEVDVREGGDAAWCAAKCRANPSCDAWTLNTSNGWCALKRQDQVKKQQRPGFVSGFKTC